MILWTLFVLVSGSFGISRQDEQTAERAEQFAINENCGRLDCAFLTAKLFSVGKRSPKLTGKLLKARSVPHPVRLVCFALRRNSMIMFCNWNSDVQRETNSGVFLRTSPKPRDVAGDCYEFNIAPADNPFPTGSLVGREKVDFLLPGNQNNKWTQLVITVNGDRITASINSESVLEYVDDQPLGKGYIGLQKNEGPVAFRNIYLKPLNLELKLDPELSHWNTDLAKESVFRFDEDSGVLNIQGGSGQIESNDQYADFILSMSCRTNARGLNSGVFYRCIPGELMNGYESQIQNEMIDSDPTAPKDCWNWRNLSSYQRTTHCRQ